MYRNPDYDALPKAERRGRLREIALVFMRLGDLAFGGPAAHIAMMEEAVVQRRAWLPRQKFMDLLGATNLIPGPNSTEMAILLGFERGGYAGLFLAGAAFILPFCMCALVRCRRWRVRWWGSSLSSWRWYCRRCCAWANRPSRAR